MKFGLRTIGSAGALGCAFLLAASLAVGQTAPAAPSVAPAPSSEFPAGAGRADFLQVCSQCHSPSEVLSNRQDGDGWAATLNTMIQNGAQGSNDQFTAIYYYLTKYFNTTPYTPPAAAAASGSAATPATKTPDAASSDAATPASSAAPDASAPATTPAAAPADATTPAQPAAAPQSGTTAPAAKTKQPNSE